MFDHQRVPDANHMNLTPLPTSMQDTTPEVLTCCADLRVLGKGEFKSLLKWRLKMVRFT